MYTVNADILVDILNTQQSLITHHNKYTYYVGISGQGFGKNSKASDFSVKNCQDPGQLDPNEIRHQLNMNKVREVSGPCFVSSFVALSCNLRNLELMTN